MTQSALDLQIAIATRTLSQLNEEAEALRAELLMMRRELSEGDREIHSRSIQLTEVNEKLVQAALDADETGDTSLSELFEVTIASQRDPLTNIPNRTLILDRIERCVALAARSNIGVAVLYLNLDHYKKINDLHGHRIGDDALWEVARRLEAAVRNSDSVGRINGDEFLVLLPAVGSEADASLVATKLGFAIAAPTYLHKLTLHISASIGIAIYPRNGLDSCTLISGAEEAMYRVKRRGGGGFEFALPPVPDLLHASPH